MTAGEDGDANDDIPPEQAFAVLGDETRVAILRALAEAGGEPVGFNDLRKLVGAKDSSGFNYHLRKLVGRFVRKTEGGYELTTAGSQVYGAILSGTYTDTVDLDPIELSDEEDVCPDCGGPLEATYEDERMSISCVDCDRVVATAAFPPAAVQGRSPSALPTAFGDYLLAMLELARNGICSQCSSPMGGHLEIESLSKAELDEETPLAVYDCERCFNGVQASPGTVLVSHPAVVSFFHGHGVDVRELPPWRLGMLRDEATTVVSEDPLRVTVDVACEGDVLRATLDEALDVVGIERA